MTPDELKTLGLLLDLLKAKGVLSCEVAGTKIQFHPHIPEAAPVILPTQSEDEKCACGCFLYQHNGGACLQGCNPDQCHPDPDQ